MERHNASRLVGAPPGYIGYEEGGQLTESVRRRPYCVILFDEIEKAHPEVFNMLLQVMEDGHLSDAKGRRVDFRNTIIILTSNIGASALGNIGPLGFAITHEQEQVEEAEYQKMKDHVLDSLKRAFKPEFLNRVDGIMVFRALSREQIKDIVDLELNRVREQLNEHDITLEATDEAKTALAKEGYDPAFGARPLRRVIQRTVEDALSEGVLSGKFKRGDTVQIFVDEQGKPDLQVIASQPESTPQEQDSTGDKPEPQEAFAL